MRCRIVKTWVYTQHYGNICDFMLLIVRECDEHHYPFFAVSFDPIDKTFVIYARSLHREIKIYYGSEIRTFPQNGDIGDVKLIAVSNKNDLMNALMTMTYAMCFIVNNCHINPVKECMILERAGRRRIFVA
jgi:hypothetical protein